MGIARKAVWVPPGNLALFESFDGEVFPGVNLVNDIREGIVFDRPGILFIDVPGGEETDLEAGRIGNFVFEEIWRGESEPDNKDKYWGPET